MLLLAVHSFLVGIPRVLTSTAAMALFLARFPAADLPYVYMGAAVAIPATGFLRLRLAGRLPLRRLLATDLLAVVAGLAAFRLALAGGQGAMVAMVLPIWYEVEWVLLNLEFWGLAGHLLNVRQAKRLFGLVGAGELVASTMAGLAIPWLVARFGTANLLLISAFAVLASLVLLRLLTAGAALEASPAETRSREEKASRRYAGLLKSRYLLLLFALVALSYLGYYVLDNAFYSVAHGEFPQESALAAFLGVFWAVVSLVTLAWRALLSARVLTRYGLVGGLLALPGAVAAGAFLIAASGLSAGPVLAAFWVMTLTKLFDQSLRDSLDRTAMLVLYQPLPGIQRVRAQTAVEGIVGPVAGGISGVTLLFLVRGLGFQPVHLAMLLLFVVAAWITVALWIRREYTETLSHALATRRLAAGALALDDASSLAVLHRGLESPRAPEALYCLETLADLGHPSYEHALPALVGHLAPEVRRQALERIERLGLASGLEAVRGAAGQEGDPVVRGVALRVLAALGGLGDLETVARHLDDPSEDVRVGALVGLMRNGGAAGLAEAAVRLERGGASPDPRSRRFVARVLGDAAATGHHRLLGGLLRDGDLDVRKGALAAAGRVRDPRLWPAVLRAFAEPATRSAARSAIVAGGEGALEAVASAFDDATAGGERAAGQRLVRLVSRIPGERAAAVLWSWGAAEDADVRHAVLSTLAARGGPAAVIDRASAERRFLGEVDATLDVVRLLDEVGEGEATTLLRGDSSTRWPAAGSGCCGCSRSSTRRRRCGAPAPTWRARGPSGARRRWS